MASVPTTFATRGRSEPLEVQTHHHDQTRTQHRQQQNHVHHRSATSQHRITLSHRARRNPLICPGIRTKRLCSSRGHTLNRPNCRSSHPRRRRKPTGGQLSGLTTHAMLTCRRDAHDLSPPPLTFLGLGPHNYIHHSLLTDPRLVTQITFSRNISEANQCDRENQSDKRRTRTT